MKAVASFIVFFLSLSLSDAEAKHEEQKLKPVESAHSYRYAAPPQGLFEDKLITKAENDKTDDLNDNEDAASTPEDETDRSDESKYAKVFSYEDHKIRPLTAYSTKTFDHPSWNQPHESNDIPDSTYNDKTDSDKLSPVISNNNANHPAFLQQHQKARIDYLKKTMVRTKLPSENLNSKMTKTKNKKMAEKQSMYSPMGASVPQQKNFYETDKSTRDNIQVTKPFVTVTRKPPPGTENPFPTKTQSVTKNNNQKNPIDRFQTDFLAESFASEDLSSLYPVYTQNVPEDDQDVAKRGVERNNNAEKRNFVEEETERMRQARHFDTSHTLDRIDIEGAYSPTGSNPLKTFEGFQNSDVLSQVGNRVPKSITALTNLNDPLFYPEKKLTPPGHQALSERAHTSTPSPYTPRFEYQATPTYTPRPLPYKGGPTTVSPYIAKSTYSPTPLPYSSTSAEYAASPTPVYSPTPYRFASAETYSESSTTRSPYFAKSTPYPPKLVDGNIDLVESRIADPSIHAPYTPSYSNSFGLNKNYGPGKSQHRALSPHSPLHHSKPVKSIHPVVPIHSPGPHVPVHPVKPHVPIHHPKPHAPIHHPEPHALLPHTKPHVPLHHPKPHTPLHNPKPHVPLHHSKPHTPLHHSKPHGHVSPIHHLREGKAHSLPHPGATRGYSVGVDHGYGTSYQKVSGFDDYGNKFGYEHGVSHSKPYAASPPYH